MSREKLVGITGATGGLGRRVTEILLRKEIRLRILVRNMTKTKWFEDNGVEVIQGDITQSSTLKDFVSELDICIHLAAQVSDSDKEKLMKINVFGTENLCDAIVTYNETCRLIYCSSIVVKNYRWYMRPFLSDYTISKYEAEKVISKFKGKIKATIIYPGYIYGGYDKNFLPQIVQMLQYPIKFFVRGGEKNAPIIYVDDLCELFYLSLMNDVAVGKKYVSLEKGTIGIHDVIKMVAVNLGYTYPNKVYPRWPLVLLVRTNSILHRLLGIKKIPLSIRVINGLSARGKYFNNAKTDLGWEQRVCINDGITRAIEALKNRQVI